METKLETWAKFDYIVLHNKRRAYTENYSRLEGVYIRNSSYYSVVNEWAKKFRMGQETLEDEDGRPADVVTMWPLWK